MSKTYERCYTLEDGFVYFIDCQLATVVDLEMLKNPPKNRLNRHKGIARKMIETARAQGIDLSNEDRVIAFEKKDKEQA